ncbi:metal ABC transporter permease [Fulvimarina sp. MAC8]|uniref:metal ABC transporter permease n=1 Tax=Fulvimarina sp. MAC8 TaxID=3162874 RepID=UPI0032EDA464
MLDDFFTRALIAGVGVALVAGPLGCFVVWRRLAYFGDTLSHAALLGVAIAFLFEANMTVAVFAVSVLVALSLLGLRRSGSIASDTLLGLLSHSALAIGLVALSFLGSVRVDLMGYLFGDILAVSQLDILQIWLGGALVLAVLAFIWRPLFAATVSPEIAQAEGHSPGRVDIVFFLLMAGVVAMALKIVGALLVTALLLIPAATARRFAATPELMAGLAALFGAASVIFGLYGSLNFDTPSGPSIVVAALALFLIAQFKLPDLRKTPAREIDAR